MKNIKDSGVHFTRIFTFSSWPFQPRPRPTHVGPAFLASPDALTPALPTHALRVASLLSLMLFVGPAGAYPPDGGQACPEAGGVWSPAPGVCWKPASAQRHPGPTDTMGAEAQRWRLAREQGWPEPCTCPASLPWRQRLDHLLHGSMSAGRRLCTLAPACPEGAQALDQGGQPRTTFPQCSPRRLATAPASGTSAPQACCCLASCRAAPTPASRGSWRRWVMSCLGACSMMMSCRRTATATATSPQQRRWRQVGTEPFSLSPPCPAEQASVWWKPTQLPEASWHQCPLWIHICVLQPCWPPRSPGDGDPGLILGAGLFSQPQLLPRCCLHGGHWEPLGNSPGSLIKLWVILFLGGLDWSHLLGGPHQPGPPWGQSRKVCGQEGLCCQDCCPWGPPSHHPTLRLQSLAGGTGQGPHVGSRKLACGSGTWCSAVKRRTNLDGEAVGPTGRGPGWSSTSGVGEWSCQPSSPGERAGTWEVLGEGGDYMQVSRSRHLPARPAWGRRDAEPAWVHTCLSCTHCALSPTVENAWSREPSLWWGGGGAQSIRKEV